MTKTVKVLYTTNYGAGWSTWCENKDVAIFIATYKPLIEAVENRHKELAKLNYFEQSKQIVIEINSDIINQLRTDINLTFGEVEGLWLEGCRNLKVIECQLPCHIIEVCDGKEEVKAIFADGVFIY